MLRQLFYRWKLILSVVFTATYLLLFNVFAIYNLATSPTHWLGEKGHLFAGGFISKLTCKTIRLSSKPLPVTALVSFPGSGYTWLRHLVQQATGVATGSETNDLQLLRKGFLAEGMSNSSVILIKTHVWGLKKREQFDRAILLIRNPFDAISSKFNRRVRGSRRDVLQELFHTIPEWENYVAQMSRVWLAMNYDWLQFKGPLHVTFFEKLKRNNTKEVTEILRFLNRSVLTEDISCMKAIFERTYHGKPTVKSFFQYSEKVRRDINNYRNIITNELRKRTSAEIEI